MKEYNAHFSFYSEQYGSFEEATIKVEAINQFEARSKAWALSESNANMEFASCIKLCGITWNASKLDLQDYFNAEVAYDKYRIQYIENVEQPNARIEKKDRMYDDWEREKSCHFTSLYTVSHIAEDLGKPHNIVSPAIFEEIHYAREFVNTLDLNDFDKASAMLEQIKRAENWDSSAIRSINELFRHGYGIANGHELDFSAQFEKNGIYPVHADCTEFASRYVQRWNNAREYKSLSSLPFFTEKDVIEGSQNMQYEWQTLLLKKEALSPDKQTPINSLWTPTGDSLGDKNSDKPITVENIFTGEIAEWKHSDFLGVLRPEKSANIHDGTIRAEYVSLNSKPNADEPSQKPKKLSVDEQLKATKKKADEINKANTQKKEKKIPKAKIDTEIE